jgi:dihydroneopterin triphosphate diphosphatase
MSKDSKVAQSIVYRKINQSFEVLILKRNKERGGFWSVVNGTLEPAESIEKCRERELFEETGIRNVINWSKELNRFSFKNNDHNVEVFAFSAEVKSDQPVKINNEHVEYKWVTFDEAIEMMKFDDDKNGLKICQRMILNK